jgi:hypothetical protein
MHQETSGRKHFHRLFLVRLKVGAVAACVAQRLRGTHEQIHETLALISLLGLWAFSEVMSSNGACSLNTVVIRPFPLSGTPLGFFE